MFIIYFIKDILGNIVFFYCEKSLPFDLRQASLTDVRRMDPAKVRYKVIGVEMKVVESCMKVVALGATQRKGKASMEEEWIRAPK